MRPFLTALLLLAARLPATASPMHTGVTGHPLTQEGYRQVPLGRQLDLVRDLGVGWYRCDTPSDTATPDGLERLASLIRQAAARRIRVLPILFPPVDLARDDEATIRRVARQYARTIVARFRTSIKVWELHNELDAFAMIHKGERDRNGRLWEWGDAAGDAPEHFEEARYARARAVLLGMCEGVSDADPTAQRIINSSGWLHYAFIQRLIADGVPFDILGWHWYSEMGEITAAGGVNVLARIAAFGKPIWINEFNRRGGSLGPNGDEEYARTIAAMASRYRELSSKYPIQGVMAYELLDEPYFGADNPESHYGLVRLKKGEGGRWETDGRKPAFDAAKTALAPRPRKSGPPSFAQLPAARRASLECRVRRKSSEIAASPFASMTSFEVHGEDEDRDVIRSMSDLGVKWVVMHNIHGSLPDPADRRLNAWLAGCKAAGIGVRCILVNRDVGFWEAAVRNYGDRIKTFSYLNEPNAPTDNDHTRPAVPAAAYAEEFGRIARAVKAVRPDVRLFGPECAMLQCMEEQPYPWLRLVLEAGLQRYADGISIHPYRQAYSPTNIPEHPSTFDGKATDRYATYEEQIATLRRMAPGKPLAENDVGWSAAPLGPLNGSTREAITELTQAKFALRQQVLDFALGMECAVYFLLRERHVGAPFPVGHIENHFGIVRTDNSPKPSYRALQTLYAQLDSRSRLRPGVPVRFGRGGVKWFVFDDVTGKVPMRRLVYWLPVPARDDFPVERTDVAIDGVRIADVPVSDAPRMLRLHRMDGTWGYPVMLDLLCQSIDTEVEWSRTR